MNCKLTVTPTLRFLGGRPPSILCCVHSWSCITNRASPVSKETMNSERWSNINDPTEFDNLKGCVLEITRNTVNVIWRVTEYVPTVSYVCTTYLRVYRALYIEPKYGSIKNPKDLHHMFILTPFYLGHWDQFRDMKNLGGRSIENFPLLTDSVGSKERRDFEY